MRDPKTDRKMVKLLEFILSKIETLASADSRLKTIIQDSKPQKHHANQAAELNDQTEKVDK